MKLRHWLICIAAGAAAATASVPARAQDFPTKPIRVVVGYTAGGGADVYARVFAEVMGPLLGQPMVVENRAGANGNIAATYVAKAPADGYTLLFVANTHVTNPDLYPNSGYDSLADFAPIGVLVSTPLMLVSRPNFGPGNVRELVSYAKANPGKVTFASAGQGSPTHLSIEMLKSSASVDIRVVTYSGGGQAQTDVMAGHVDLAVAAFSQALSEIKAGRFKALGQTGTTRSSQAPEVPTLAESGVPGYESTAWYGLLAPAKVPAPVMAKLNKALNDSLANPDIKARLRSQGADAVGGSLEQTSAFMRADQQRWRKVIKDANIKLE